MGNKCCCRKNTTKQIIVLLLVGLDNAGKTVAAKGLAGEATDSVVPTVGFSVVNLRYLNYHVKIYDLGGDVNIRGIWPRYFVDILDFSNNMAAADQIALTDEAKELIEIMMPADMTHGVIFVVDSSDVPRLEEAKLVLEEVLRHEKIAGKPILVLANKQDNKCALDEVDIIENLNIESIVNFYKCPTLVESCSATESTENIKIDPGIRKGYEWLLSYIIRNYGALNQRIQVDVQEQLAIEHRLRIELLEKYRLFRVNENKKETDEDAIESYSDYERKINSLQNVKAKEQRVGTKDSQLDTSSEDSSHATPRIYHVEDDILLERPRSAVEIVKRQLQLNNLKKKPSFVNHASNKTTPFNIYNVSHSAKCGRRNRDFKGRRFLKSAGDSPQRTDLPSVPCKTDGGDFYTDLFILSAFHTTSGIKHAAEEEARTTEQSQVPSLYKHINGASNAMSIVDVDL